MVDNLKVGMKLHARYTDGQFYAASVEAISTAKKRKKHPVKVVYLGHNESEWKSIGDLRSKALPEASTETKSTAKMWDYSGLEIGTRLQAESQGKYYAAEVVTVAKSKARAKAPVKVHWVGYTAASDEWMSGDRLRSKALKKVLSQVGRKNHDTKSRKTILVTVTDASGMTLWGPKQIDPSTSGGDFATEVINDLGEHFATEFVLDASVLDSETSLAVQGVVDGSCLTMVRPAELTKVKALYARLCATLAAKGPDSWGRQLVNDWYAAPETEALELLKIGIPKDLDLEALPEDVFAWVQVLLTSGKCISLSDEDFSLSPCLWLDTYGKGPDKFIDGSPRPQEHRSSKRIFYSKGLLYLNMYGNNDNVIMHIVDIDGGLGRTFGSGDKGSVWYANAWDQIYAVDNPFTTDSWQRIRDRTADPDVRLDAGPVCVAPSLERFFEAFAATGKPPGHEYIRSSREYGPNEACLWLEGKSSPPMIVFEVNIAKVQGKELGIGMYCSDMSVAQIIPGGLAENWNLENQSLAIKPADKILEVNGKAVCNGPTSGWQDTSDEAVKVLRIKFGRVQPE